MKNDEKVYAVFSGIWYWRFEQLLSEQSYRSVY